MNKKSTSLFGADTFLYISHAIIQEVDEGVIVTDSEGRILLTNPAFETVTGYAQEEVLGKKPNILRSGLHDRKLFKNGIDI